MIKKYYVFRLRFVSSYLITFAINQNKLSFEFNMSDEKYRSRKRTNSFSSVSVRDGFCRHKKIVHNIIIPSLRVWYLRTWLLNYGNHNLVSSTQILPGQSSTIHKSTKTIKIKQVAKSIDKYNFSLERFTLNLHISQILNSNSKNSTTIRLISAVEYFIYFYCT